jgi:hypothetical protein
MRLKLQKLNISYEFCLKFRLDVMMIFDSTKHAKFQGH